MVVSDIDYLRQRRAEGNLPSVAEFAIVVVGEGALTLNETLCMDLMSRAESPMTTSWCDCEVDKKTM